MGKRPNAVEVSRASAILIALVLCPGSSGREHQFMRLSRSYPFKSPRMPFLLLVSAQEVECKL